jgi:alpha-ketoglutarate-dependent taurine dioxygenase
MKGMTALEIRDLDAAFGAEVVGFDPEVHIDEEARHTLQRAFDERGLLVFRGREIPYDLQVQLCEMLTTPEGVPIAPRARSIDDYYVSNQREDGATPFGRLPFHSDGMWSTQPYFALSLYGVEIEQPTLPTNYVSTAVAWRSLPDELRSRVDELHAVHALGVIPRGEHVEEIVVADFGADVTTVAPVAHLHPRTGTPLLYVCQSMTREIVELPPDVSEALLTELFEHLYRPENVLAHEWRDHDLLIWDNVAVQHARPNVRPDGPARTLRKYGTPDMDLTAVNVPTYTERS